MTPIPQRQKVLLAVTSLMLLVIVGYWLVSWWRGPLKKLENQRASVRREIDGKLKKIKKGQEAQQRLDAWAQASLPADVEMARSLYQNWLLTLAAEARFDGTKVEAGQGRQRGDVYHALRFSLQAQAPLDRLVRFLQRFYTAGHLHQIRSMSLVPIDKSEKLDVQLSIEALVLPKADRKDKLTEAPATRLAASPDAYRIIATRNLFAPYKPLPPPRVQTPPPPFDLAKYAYLTAIVASNGKPEAWLLVRANGKKLQLHEGDPFEIGDLRGKIVRIGEREVDVEICNQRWRLPLGDNLREMTRLPE
jgi:hypothetical protein